MCLSADLSVFLFELKNFSIYALGKIKGDQSKIFFKLITG